MTKHNSFSAETDIVVDGSPVHIWSLPALERAGFPRVNRLPYSLKILLENLLRREDGRFVEATTSARSRAGTRRRAPQGDRVHAGARAAAGLHRRSGGRGPCRHARRRSSSSAATRRASTRSSRSNWSSITRCRWITSGEPTRSGSTPTLEFTRNQERYTFLRWGQQAFQQLPRRAARHRHRPPGQPRVPRARGLQGRGRRPRAAYPDTLVGTDSHTTMVNGLGRRGLGRRRDRGRGVRCSASRSRC